MATGGNYSSTTAGNEIFYDWRCKTCEENDCMAEAIAYCKDCKECYCVSCLRDHNKFVSLRGHSVLGEQDKDSWGKSNNSPIVLTDPGIKCSEHKGESISMYCGNHDEVCCPVCAFMKHGEVCKPRMSYIPSFAQGIGSGAELKELMTTNEQLRLRIEQIEKKKSEGLAVVSTSRKKCRKKVSDICQKYIARIKELERISITNVNKKHDDEEKNIQSDIDQCAEERLQLHGVKQQMQAKHPINDSALFISLKAGQKCHQRCKEVCESLTRRKMKTFEFHEDPDILQAYLPKTLGECRESIPKYGSQSSRHSKEHEPTSQGNRMTEKEQVIDMARSTGHMQARFPPRISKNVAEFFLSDLLGKYSNNQFKFKLLDDHLEYEGPTTFLDVFSSELTSLLSKLGKEIQIDQLDLSDIENSMTFQRKEFEKNKVFLEYSPDDKQIQFYGIQWNEIQKVKNIVIAKLSSSCVKSRGDRQLGSSDLSAAVEGNGGQSVGGSNGGARQKTSKTTGHSVSSAANFSWFQKTTNVEVFTVGKVTVKVYCADIIEVPVDCIVNAANSQLQHHGGIAKFIAKAAGPTLKKECEKFIREHGSLKVGEACHTSAGDLPYLDVIHTVGPCWSWYKPHDLNQVKKCENDLEMAIRNSLSQATNLWHSSIAIPAVSAGKFGCPEELCAVQYARAVLSYTKLRCKPVKEIHFVDKNEAMVKEIHRVFKDVQKEGGISARYDTQKFVTSLLSRTPTPATDKGKIVSCPSQLQTLHTLNRLHVSDVTSGLGLHCLQCPNVPFSKTLAIDSYWYPDVFDQTPFRSCNNWNTSWIV